MNSGGKETTMDVIKAIEAEQAKRTAEEFRIGDTVKVHFKIIEGKTERIQVFEGIVLAMKREGSRKTFTVRKISYGVGVERTFPLYSPKIAKIVRVREGKVRRAKLYYIRGKYGKAAKVAELIHRKRGKVPETGASETPEAAASQENQ
jgi:large subunit ribosomal protein L19